MGRRGPGGSPPRSMPARSRSTTVAPSWSPEWSPSGSSPQRSCCSHSVSAMDARGSLFLLGGPGFIGGQVVSGALAAGWRVKALTRSAEGRQALEAAGAEPIEGAAEAPSGWAEEAGATAALIDLVQPKFP